jgi:hypothetical protein
LTVDEVGGADIIVKIRGSAAQNVAVLALPRSLFMLCQF